MIMNGLYEDFIDFPEYGKQVELNEPYRGYHRGTIISKDGYKFVVKFSSGMTESFYSDEFEID